MNTPATPTATAARASTGTNSRSPPDEVPFPPGCCTEWVASKITGAPVVLRQDRQRAHVRHQRVVAERGAALGDQHVRVAAAGDLGDDIGHVPRREELPLLDVDDLAGRGRRQQQIGLPAQERRDLQHVDRLRDFGALRGLVHVGQHGQAERGADLGEDRQRLRQARCRARPSRWCGWPCRTRSCRRARFRGGRRSPSARTPLRAHARGSRAGTARR